MISLIDVIAPVFVGEDKFVLNVDEISFPLQTFKPIQVNVDYTSVDSSGVSVPLELVIQPAQGTGGSQGGYVERIFRRLAPNRFLFRPQVPGSYLILLREIHHNRHQGRLVLEVEGDKYAEPIVRSRS